MMPGSDGTEALSEIHQADISAPPTLFQALYQNTNSTFHRICDFAEYLENSTHAYWIHSIYGGADGFVLAYSLLKYVPDLIYNASKTESEEALHEFIYNPWGGTITVAWLASLAIMSAYANGMNKQKDNENAQAYYANWQAFRDGAKGLRNAHRGIRSTLDAIKLFSSIDVRYALMPLGLIIGIPSMYNRWWNRQMVTVRKQSMGKNKALSEELLNWGRFNDDFETLPDNEHLKKDHANSFLLINKNNIQNRQLYYIDRLGNPQKVNLSSENITAFITKIKHAKHPSVMEWCEILPDDIATNHFTAFCEDIKSELTENTDRSKHAHNNRIACYLSAGYDGLTGGLYYYMGLISLITLSPEMLFAVAAISTGCLIASIITRLQQEWEYDKKLRIEEQKAQLIFIVKDFQIKLAKVGLLTLEMKQIQEKLKTLNVSNEQNKSDLEAELNNKTQEMNTDNTNTENMQTEIVAHYNKLLETSSISYREAILIGLGHGLTAHGTLVCGVFATALIGKVFFAATLPQIIIPLCLAISLLMTIAAIAIAISYVSQYKDKQEQNKTRHKETLERIVNKIKKAETINVFAELDHQSGFADLCDGTPFISWTLTSWLEILRATGSGMMKGLKSIDFLSFAFFDASSQYDHKHDDPILSVILVVSLALYTIIWCLRALAKYSDDLREQVGSQPTTNTNNTNIETYETPNSPASPSRGAWPWPWLRSSSPETVEAISDEQLSNPTHTQGQHTLQRAVSENNIRVSSGRDIGLFSPKRPNSALELITPPPASPSRVTFQLPTP